MKPEELYEKRQAAGQIGAVMLLAAMIGTIASVTALLLGHGWVPCLELAFLSLILFGLSRVFGFIDDLLGEIGGDKHPPFPVANADKTG